MSASSAASRELSTTGLHSKRSATGTMVVESGSSQFYTKYNIVAVAESGETDNMAAVSNVRVRKLTPVMNGSTTRFPKLEECAHFHYEFVDLGAVELTLLDSGSLLDENNSVTEHWYQIQVHCSNTSTGTARQWEIRRTYETFYTLDRQLHKCIFDRKLSLLPELRRDLIDEIGPNRVLGMVSSYVHRFSTLQHNMINCGPVLSWLEMDNRGNRLIVSDNDAAINVPAIGAAHVVKRYATKASDELTLEVGDIVSIIDKPPADESLWWRGKKEFEVGFFPAECVEVIGEKVPPSVATKVPDITTKPVLHKRGKLISFLLTFLSSRPARTQLKRTGIVRERVFGCDLGEHLLNSGHDVPVLLRTCTEVIELHGKVDGIYRLSGVASNIQRLRTVFDEDQMVPTITDDILVQDIHSVSSLLKLYFRELPNPLFTYQLYSKFVEATDCPEQDRVSLLQELVLQLPPPHYRTAAFLMRHLSRMAAHSSRTGMHFKNLAIVWAPNLLRCSKELEQMQYNAEVLKDVCLQGIITEYLISHADQIFDDTQQNVGTADFSDISPRQRSATQNSTSKRLLTLEEAQERNRVQQQNSGGKYIEVGGGPLALPSKYHTVIDVPKSKKRSHKSSAAVKPSSPPSSSSWRLMFTKSRSLSLKDNTDSVQLSTVVGAEAHGFGHAGTDGDYELHLSEDDAVMEKGRKIHSESSLVAAGHTAAVSPPAAAPSLTRTGSVWRDTKRISMSCDIPIPTLTDAVMSTDSLNAAQMSLPRDCLFRKPSSLMTRTLSFEAVEGSAAVERTSYALPADNIFMKPPPVPPRLSRGSLQLSGDVGVNRPAALSPVSEPDNSTRRVTDSIVRSFFLQSPESRDSQSDRKLSDSYGGDDSPERQFMSWSLNKSPSINAESSDLVSEVSQRFDALFQNKPTPERKSLCTANDVSLPSDGQSCAGLAADLSAILSGLDNSCLVVDDLSFSISTPRQSVSGRAETVTTTSSCNFSETSSPVNSSGIHATDSLDSVRHLRKLSGSSVVDSSPNAAAGTTSATGATVAVSPPPVMRYKRRVRSQGQNSQSSFISEMSDDILSEMNSRKQLTETAVRLYDKILTTSPTPRPRSSVKHRVIHSDSSDVVVGDNSSNGSITSAVDEAVHLCDSNDGGGCEQFASISRPADDVRNGSRSRNGSVSSTSTTFQSTNQSTSPVVVLRHESKDTESSECRRGSDTDSCSQFEVNRDSVFLPESSSFVVSPARHSRNSTGSVFSSYAERDEYDEYGGSKSVSTFVFRAGIASNGSSSSTVEMEVDDDLKQKTGDVSEDSSRVSGGTLNVNAEGLLSSCPADESITRSLSIKEIKSRFEKPTQNNNNANRIKSPVAESTASSSSSSVAERRQHFQSSSAAAAVADSSNSSRKRFVDESSLAVLVEVANSCVHDRQTKSESSAPNLPSEHGAAAEAVVIGSGGGKGRFVTRSSVFVDSLGTSLTETPLQQELREFGRLTDRRRVFESSDNGALV